MSENKPVTAYKQQLRERIVETAMKAFSKRGIRAVKMDDIAQELSISKRTLYELYDNKEELLCEGVRKYRELREAEMLDCVTKSDNVIDILLSVYRSKVEEFRNTGEQFYTDLVKYPHVMALLEESRQANHERLTDFLHRGVSEGYFRADVDYELVSQLFDAIGHQIMSHQLYRQHSIEQLFYNLVFISLRGFCTMRGVEALDRSLLPLEVQS